MVTDWDLQGGRFASPCRDSLECRSHAGPQVARQQRLRAERDHLRSEVVGVTHRIARDEPFALERQQQAVRRRLLQIQRRRQLAERELRFLGRERSEQAQRAHDGLGPRGCFDATHVESVLHNMVQDPVSRSCTFLGKGSPSRVRFRAQALFQAWRWELHIGPLLPHYGKEKPPRSPPLTSSCSAPCPVG